MTRETKDFEAIGYLYGGDMDVSVEHQKTKRLKVKFKQVCCSVYHRNTVKSIPAGEECVRETALVDGKWSTAYTCLPCIDQALKELQ